MNQTTKDTEIHLKFCNFEVMFTISWLSFQRTRLQPIFLETRLRYYRDVKLQYALHQDKNRAKIETSEKEAVCIKSSGVR
jgi:hypothetical protein